MKNSELLTYTGRHLSSRDSQRRFLVREYVIGKACPNCATPVNVFQATGIAMDDYDFDGRTSEGGHCPNCKRGLNFILPIMGGWRWALVPIEGDASNG